MTDDLWAAYIAPYKVFRKLDPESASLNQWDTAYRRVLARRVELNSKREEINERLTPQRRRVKADVDLVIATSSAVEKNVYLLLLQNPDRRSEEMGTAIADCERVAARAREQMHDKRATPTIDFFETVLDYGYHTCRLGMLGRRSGRETALSAFDCLAPGV